MREHNRLGRLTALGIISALTLGACGGGSASTTETSAAAKSETTADKSETTTAQAGTTETTATKTDNTEAETSGEATKIPVWIAFEDYRLDWAKEVAAKFNETVDGYEVEITGFGSYNDVFEAAVQATNSGKPPAVIHFFEAATQEARDAVTQDGEPVFANLEDIIAGRNEVAGVPVVLNDVVDAASTYYKLDGKYSSMPWNTSSAIMFVNRSLLEAAGVEGTPTTWQELEAACEKFMASAAKTDGCTTWPNHSWFVEQQVAWQNELFVNNDNGRSARADKIFVDSDAVKNFVGWWKGMSDKGFYTYTGTQRDWSGSYDLFAAQKVPFLLYSSSDTAGLTEEGKKGGFDVEAAFMPRNADVDGGGAIIGGATNWVINGLDEKTQDGAIAWVNFLSNPENAASWHKTTGYIPISNESIKLLEGEGYYAENPNQKIASEQLAASPDTPATTGPLVGNFVAIRDVITEGIEDILVNNVDPAERLAKAQTAAQALLDEYNLLFSN